MLSYAAVAEVLLKKMTGHANAALNLLHIGAAFLIQAGIGLIVGLWDADAEGRYPTTAYAVAFHLTLIPQMLALGWFLLAPRLPGKRLPTAARCEPDAAQAASGCGFHGARSPMRLIVWSAMRPRSTRR